LNACILPNEKKGKMNKPIIVEFNGLPGLGKTTVADILMEKLNDYGFKTVNRLYRRNVFYTLHHPVPEMFSPVLYKRVKSFAHDIPPEGKKRTHVHWTNFFAQKYNAIKKHSGADFAVIDEGIIQFLVAMAFQDKMPISDKADAIVEKLKALGICFVRVDCVNHIEESANRIMSRPSRGLVFESMQRDELLRTLEAEASNFEYMRSVFSKIYEDQLVITIDTQLDPHENAVGIMRTLVKQLA
jgi:hypothetical protein